MASNIIYARHGLDDVIMEGITLSMDHRQQYGITARPMFTLPVSKTLRIHVKFPAGAFRLNSSNAEVARPVEIFEYAWANTFSMQLSAGLRYYFGEKAIFWTKLDFTAMQPGFKRSDGMKVDGFGRKLPLRTSASVWVQDAELVNHENPGKDGTRVFMLHFSIPQSA